MGRARNQRTAVSMDLFDPVLGSRRGNGDGETPVSERATQASLRHDWLDWKEHLPVTHDERERLYEQHDSSSLPLTSDTRFHVGARLMNHPLRSFQVELERTGLLVLRTGESNNAVQLTFDAAETGVFMLHCQQLLTGPSLPQPPSMCTRMRLERPDGSYTDPEEGRLWFHANEITGTPESKLVVPELKLVVAGTLTNISFEAFELRALNGWLLQYAPITEPPV